MGSWIKHELSGLLNEILSQKSIEKRGLFRWETVKKTMELHNANKEDHTDHLQALLNLEIWCRLYMDQRSPEDITLELSEFVL